MAQKLMREMFRLSFGEEVGNAVSHGVMAVITFIVLPLFAVYSYIQGGVIRAAGTSIYLMCMFFMFLTSTIYHSMSYGSPQKYVFRKLDHIAILFAIAGSYTPVCLSLIQGTSGIVILIIEWSMVLAGVLLKAIAKRSYPILSMVIYMVMGWCAVFFLPTLLQPPSRCSSSSSSWAGSCTRPAHSSMPSQSTPISISSGICSSTSPASVISSP